MFAQSCDRGALGGAHHPTEIPVLKGFRDFLMRGNIIELAIAVVIGTAFTALVASFSKFIINPIIASIGGHSVNGLAFYLVPGNAATLVDIGGVLTAAINFVITAAVVYFIFVVPMNKLAERRKKNLEPVAVDPDRTRPAGSDPRPAGQRQDDYHRAFGPGSGLRRPARLPEGQLTAVKSSLPGQPPWCGGLLSRYHCSL